MWTPKLHFKYKFFMTHERMSILCPELFTNAAVLRLKKTFLYVLDRNKEHYKMDGNIDRQREFIIKSISLPIDSVWCFISDKYELFYYIVNVQCPF